MRPNPYSRKYTREPAEKTCENLGENYECCLCKDDIPENWPIGADELGYCDITNPDDCEEYCPKKSE